MTLFPTRPILILLATSALGASLAACASPNFPIAPQVITPPPPTTPAAPPPRDAEPAPEIPRARESVESRPLDAPAPTAPRAATPSPAPSQPAYAPPPAPTYRTVTTRTVTGRVVDVEGPAATYTVKKGDNLEAIARKLDTTVEQLAKDNKLKKPYVIHPGDDLKGPRTTAKAYTVEQGDTLFGIARRFTVTADALRDENDLGRNATLRPGQRLRLPKGFKDKGPTVTTSRVQVDAPAPQPAPPAVRSEPPRASPPPIGAQPPRATTPPPGPAVAPPRTETPPALPSRPQPYRPSGSSSVPAPRPSPPPASTPAPSANRPIVGAPVASPPVSDSQVSSLGQGRFIWPLRGEILSGFGPKGPSQRNDGINIRVNAGEAVRAAAAGDVVYAGDQVPGFGNLVLIKHADGWVTAYGHLGRVDVKMQQKVTQGQQIGQAGSSGGVSEPQLHFEVRYAPTPEERARPIDPALVLPR
ncbi:LysM peptidoglycan-binding domain-containing M23 family metallopeptidase [Phenylobacterium sp. J426]|uniref:LysM peptidoglycan-binding domain-containing M23 family metallopeptidase n=1 Tax=Phenylobacterium sp. J426 TaxID=2898439 RepID=UPI0021514DA1|nr:LysM peptidoglycan-binding domain-containing M23 family metallopeptidase [Phenylobacterium sp. J426]MCR5876033.1 LysM peptidoglycan-binding domain-containing M23 family metallopeptidase [Phenylobacterium sp. J426]